MDNSDGIKRLSKWDKIKGTTVEPTKEYWSPNGSWRCVCKTPSHKKGQRLTEPQCSYCVRVNDE